MERGDVGGGMMGQRGAMASAAAAAEMLGMEMHMAQHPTQMQHVAAFQQPDHSHHRGGGFPLQPVPVTQQAPPTSYSPYPAVAASRGAKVAAHEEEGGGGVQQQPGASGCPWSRMKWTDAMVRLLITVVYNAGDDGDGVSGGGKATAAHGKTGASAAAHGHGAHGQAAAQQKKGKWKSVSRSMMENGFMVSPQQCEDKFNDLNKRYKRVVDILGRGKACKVVENPALLDAMDELTPKAKDEARKLLSSKHLFFREMCTYHNSVAAAPSQNFIEGAACFHHQTSMAGVAASSAVRQVASHSPAMMNSSARAEAEEDEDSQDAPTSKEVEEDDDDEYDDEEEHRGGRVDVTHRFHHHNGYRKRRRGEDDGTAEEEELDGDKRARRTTRAGEEGSSAVQQLQRELAAAAAAVGGDLQQMRQWMRRRAVEVEEQQVVHECRMYQLERQRLKWERFRASKERDMERARLRNDRLRLEGRRMLLLLRQKDLDLDVAEANYSSSIDHHPGAYTPPPPAAFPHHHQLGSSPSTAGHPN